MKKYILGIIAILLLLTKPAFAEDFEAAAKSAFALEVSTGKILYEKNSQKNLPVGPTSKLLTAYIVYREVKAGKLNWSDSVTISDYAYHVANLDLSNVPLDARKYTVKELTRAMLVTSANGATIALAEHIAGSEPAFVNMMTQQLKDWGIPNAKLVNATGLSNADLGEGNLYPNSSPTDENKMSAQALATIAYHLITDFPQVTKITSKSQASFGEDTIHSYNLMLPSMPYFRGGVDGLATGTTEKAGSSFVASATTNSMRVITVILNADGWEENAGARFMATNDLLNYIAGHYYPHTILKKGKTLEKATSPVLDGKSDTVKLISKTPLTVIRPIADTQEPPITYEANQSQVYAPLAKNKTLGHFIYNDPNRIGDGYIGQLPSVKAITKEEVEKSFFLKVWWNHFVRYVNENL